MQVGQVLPRSLLLPFLQGKKLRTKEVKHQAGIRVRTDAQVDLSPVLCGVRPQKQVDETNDKFFGKQSSA